MNMIRLLSFCLVIFVGFSTSLFGVAEGPDGVDSEFSEGNFEDEEGFSSGGLSETFLLKDKDKDKDVDEIEDVSLEQPVEVLDTLDSEGSQNVTKPKPVSTMAAKPGSGLSVNKGVSVDFSGGQNDDGPTMDMDDDMLDIVESYEGLRNRKQFKKANEVLSTIPLAAMDRALKKQKRMLDIYESIAVDKAENERQFGKDESLDDSVQRTIKRLQRQAKVYILDGRSDLPRDLLIQSLYLDRKNFESKQLLDRCLGMPLGSYQVENVEKKYWNNSLIELRSGFPSKSVDSLQMLANFDPENPMIFERMGSALYMTGRVKEAVDSWKRALYLSPERTDLKSFIANAEKEISRQEVLSKAYFESKKNASQSSASNQPNVPMQVLRVVDDSNSAFSYAQEVRQQLGRNINVVVEELDNGKWAVKVPQKK